MSSSSPTSLQTRWVRPCTRVWLALLALTGLMFGVGKLHLGGGAVVSILLLVTFLKGQMVADYFMGLRRVRWGWRLLMYAWLALVVGLIGLAYRLGM